MSTSNLLHFSIVTAIHAILDTCEKISLFVGDTQMGEKITSVMICIEN